jgi:hypothetical protein
MFKAEVEIMSAVISELEKQKLSESIIYVYDEIMTTKANANKVRDIMMKISASMGYNLTVKVEKTV